MKVKKNDILDFLILSSMFLQLVILGFFGLTSAMNRIVSLLIVIRIIVHPHFIPRRAFFLSTFVLILFFLSSRIGVVLPSALQSNFLLIFYSLIYAFYGFYVCKYNPIFIKRVLNKSFGIVNFVVVLNTIVMLIQIFFPYSIQAKITIAEIAYYKDTISGLFSYGSTHVAGLYCIFVVLYNLSYGKNSRKREQKKILCYTILLVIVNSFISLNNDNKAFFFLLTIFVMLYISLDNNLMSKNKIRRIIYIILIIAYLFPIVYYMAPSVSRFIDSSVIGLLSDFLSNYRAGTTAVGSNERIAIIGYALSLSSTWKFGMGIGTAQLSEPGLYGFRHFGQSDMGSFMILLGIWFFIAITLLYMYFCISIIKGNSSRRLPGIFVITLGGSFLILSMYTQVFSRTNIVTCILFIAFALHKKVKNMSKKDACNRSYLAEQIICR